MKKNLLITLLSTISITVLAQTQGSVTRTINFGGKSREYRLHVPASYNANQKVPLVFVFHGLGDNMGNMEGVGMTLIGDTANFITITPQALADPLAGTAWNSGAGANLGGIQYFPNQNVDDVGFVSKMIDTTAAEFNIDLRKVYACRFSMGGYMTNRLACELNNRIAAFGPVAATIGAGITCTPNRPLPIITFHGTSDATVSYDSASFGMSVPQLLNFWKNNNGCNSLDSFAMPDIANDGYTVEHFVYGNCSPTSALEHFKVYGADHTWLGPGDDIFYTAEIWKFFSRFQHPNQSLDVNEKFQPANQLSVLPNPIEMGGKISINLPKTFSRLQLTNLKGQLVMEISGIDQKAELGSENLQPGIYFLNANSKTGQSISSKLIIN